MKGKTLLSLAIVLSMILAAAPFIATNVKAAPNTTVSVVLPNGGQLDTIAYGSNFKVNVTINTNQGIGFYDIKVGWNNSVLNLNPVASSAVVEGPWMKAFGGTLFPGATLTDDSAADVPDGLLTYPPAATGSGTMFIMSFTAVGYGKSEINILAGSSLLNGTLLVAVPIDLTVNANVTVPTPPATSPKAIITLPTPLETFTTPTTVTLIGNASTNGIDTFPSVHTVPITVWNWTVVNASGTYYFSGSVVTIPCTSPGTVTITLTVFAPPNDPTSGYVDSSSATVTIFQVAPSVGPKIDVYTDRGGKGILGAFPYPYGWSDAYAPQELVCVYANVTYNNAPVWYKPVEFVVYLPNGTEIASYEAFTNESGIAKVCFRIPWEANQGPSYFGNMSITGTVSISQVQVSDTVKFPYGWILSISSITALPSPVHRYPQTPDVLMVSVTIDSIEITGGPSHPAYLQITASDNANVPFGQAFATLSVPPAGLTSTGNTITVPEWAYVGAGLLYVDLLNHNATGVPWCPESTYPITIVYP